MPQPKVSLAPPLPAWLTPQYPFIRHVIDLPWGPLSFVDEGKGLPVVMLHGNPMWGYLWRHIIPPLLSQGFRVIVPDLYGFGASAKPSSPSDHQLEMHVQSIASLLHHLQISETHLMAQDWGGPILLGAAMRASLNVQGVTLGNTAVLKPRDQLKPTTFHRFSHLPLVSDLVFRGMMFPLPVLGQAQGDKKSFSWSSYRAYFHWFWNPLNRAGPLGLARMVPNRHGHPSLPLLHEIGDYVTALRCPMQLVWGTRDPILGRTLRRHREALSHATVIETQAGHFLQEEVPSAFVEAVLSCGYADQT